MLYQLLLASISRATGRVYVSDACRETGLIVTRFHNQETNNEARHEQINLINYQLVFIQLARTLTTHN